MVSDSTPPEPGFEVLDETLRHKGPVITVYEARVRTPSGEVVRREIARHPGAVVVVPVIDGDAVLVRQYRAAVDRSLLEIPAGKRDMADEPPEVTAARELAEEVGLRASRLELLAAFHNTPGFCDEYSYLYLATGCEEVPHDRQGAEEEHMTIERMPLAEVPDRIADGTLSDGKTLIGLLLAREHLSS